MEPRRAATGTAGRTPPVIVDSHVHLYPASEQHTLAWMTPRHGLRGQHSLDEYTAAAAAGVAGLVFVEADRATTAGSHDGWAGALAEVAFARRLAGGWPRAGEGHTAAQRRLAWGVVPWAPVAGGGRALRRWTARAREAAGEACWARVCGFRQLAQQRPRGLVLRDGFVDGLRWLGREGFAFDLGIDCHRDGLEWLDDAVEMVGRAHEGVPDGERVTIIIDHLCKPDMTLVASSRDVAAHPAFERWLAGVTSLSRCANTYMKLSGCLSELPPGFASGAGADAAAAAGTVFAAVRPWLAAVLAAFGPARVMFGSDWPVCTLGVRGGACAAAEGAGASESEGEGEGETGAAAWELWRLVVERMCDAADLDAEERAMVWGGTAMAAYGIAEPAAD